MKNRIFEFLSKDTGSATSIDVSFLVNLTMSLSQTLRNMAFARDAHVRTLDDKAREISETKKFWNDLTQLTSFSKQGVPVQILSFLGFGSAATLDVTVGEQSVPLVAPFSQIIQNITSVISQGDVQQYALVLTYFILFGVLGVIFATIILKIIGFVYVSWKRQRIEQNQYVYYRTIYKNDMADELFKFYNMTKEVVNRYYPKDYVIAYMDEFTGWSERELKRYILKNILPSNNIHWPEWQARDSSDMTSQKEES